MEGNGKMYYGIKEVADMFGINASKIRYYETKFETLEPKKKRSGDRAYSQSDIDHLREILDLIDKQKFTIPGAQEYLKARAERQRENARYIRKLEKIKTFMERLRDGLASSPIEEGQSERPNSAADSQ